MATANLSFNSLESNPYNSVLTLMDTRSNIADPRDPNGLKSRTFVYDFDPFHLAIDFNDLPYIILELPTIDYGIKNLKGSRKQISYTHRITVRTAKRGASNARTDIGKTDMLNICDDMQQMFNSVSVKQAFMNLNLYNFDLRKISVNTYSVDQKYLYEAVYELTYDTPFKDVQA